MRPSARVVALTGVLSALAVVLSLLSVPFLLGSRIHFFQVGIMLAGAAGGPAAGFLVGGIGAVYMASVRSDPTIIVGNALLGLGVGVLCLRFRPVLAGLAAWALFQAPWIFLTGTLIFHVPLPAMELILGLLTVEDVICALVADVLVNRFHMRSLIVGSARLQ